MIRHPVITAMVKQGLVNGVEGRYLEYVLGRTGNGLASAIAEAGFKDIAPAFNVLEQDLHGEEAAGETEYQENPLIADMTFHTFVPKADSNQSAVESTLRLCRESSLPSSLLFIHGAEGLGKTHLLTAACQEMERRYPQRHTLLASMLDLAMALARAGRRGSRNDLIDFLSHIDNLLIDDIQLCESGSQVQADLLEVITRQLDRPRHRLICTCDVAPGELQLNDPGLRTAIASGTIAEIRPPAEIESAEMLLIFARGTYLPYEIRNYIVKNTADGIRERKAVVMRLIDLSRSMNKEIWLELAGAVLPGIRQGSGSGSIGLADAGGTETAGKSPESRRPNNHSQALKEMIRSAQSKEDRALADQVALSQMIKSVSSRKSPDSRPLSARLRLALQAIREADLATASELVQGYA